MASGRKKDGDRFAQGGTHCTAFGCQNSAYKASCKGKSFFIFPKDETRLVNSCFVCISTAIETDQVKHSALKCAH